MKFILCAVSVILSLAAHAESALETDDGFFKSSVAPYEDDDLDRSYKKNELTKSTEHQKKVESNVTDEFSSTHQGIMPAYEAQMMDQKIVAENKRRQAAIMRRLSSSSGAVYDCVTKNSKNFQGTYTTVKWLIAPSGKVMEAAIKSTDIENTEIQKCIEEVALNLDFSSAKTDLLKKSLVEYSYKFKKKSKTGALKKTGRRTAGQLGDKHFGP
jgi:hypothetical protein